MRWEKLLQIRELWSEEQVQLPVTGTAPDSLSLPSTDISRGANS